MNIKLLLVSANKATVNILNDIISNDSEIQIVSLESDAFRARDAILEKKPDAMLLCDDLQGMSGIVFLEKLLPQYEIPTVFLGGDEVQSRAYDAGTTDFIKYDKDNPSLLYNERIAKRIKKSIFPDFGSKPYKNVEKQTGPNSSQVIAIGASTGGTEATSKVLRGLHADLPGIVMVQHMPVGFTAMYAERLNSECEVSVKEAKTGDVVRTGQVLLAPGDKHMRLVKVNGVYQVECQTGPKVSGHCPSVDVLFHSVAKVAGQEAVGIILTGMGRDGADGLLAMRRAGASTIGQNEETCVVYGMPREAYEIGAVQYQLPLEQISTKLYHILNGRKGK